MSPLGDLPTPGERFIVMDHDYDKAFGPYNTEDEAKIAAFNLGREGYLSTFDEVSIVRISKPVTS